LVETLEPVAGAGNVRASVNVDYDPMSADEVDETYDPAQAVTLTMQRSEQTSGKPLASGIPGTASNAPNAKPPLYPQQDDSAQNTKQESDTYGVSKKTRHTMEGAGAVRRMTAAVLINDRRVVEGKQVKWQPRSPEELQSLSDLAKSAIGFDSARGDQVSVEEMAFDNDMALPPVPLGERLVSMAGESPSLIRYGTILTALLVFFFFVARPALRLLASPPVRREAAANAAAAQPRLAADEPARELTAERQAAEQRKLHAQTVFEQVSEQVKRDPAQSTRLLESWIRSE
jgi:flagellar M-ring protein FliF